MSRSLPSLRGAALVLGVGLAGLSPATTHAAEPAPTFNVELLATSPNPATAVVVEGAYAYVARGAAGLDVVDRTNPLAPVVVSTILPGDGAAVYIRDCAVKGGFVYLANWDDVPNGLTGKFTGVYVYDVHVPSAPVEVSRIDWGSAAFYHQAAMVYDLAVADVAGAPYAFFCSEITSSVEVFDVSNPADPVYATTLARPTTGGLAEDVTVLGTTAYVAWLNGGISSFDLTGLAAIAANNAVATDYGSLLYPPLLMSHKGVLGNARGVAVASSGQTLVVTDDYGSAKKLRIYDISNPYTAVLAGTFSPASGASPYGVVVDGSRAYVAWGVDGLRVIDFSSPSAPTQIARYDTANSKRCVVSGSRVLLADGTQGTLTLGFKDSVTITSARWKQSTRVLTITATSTAHDVVPPALLTVVGRGTMTYSAGVYTFTQTVNPKPATVSVTSSWGGSATATVVRVN